MSEIRNAFKALEDLVDDIKIEPIKKKVLLKEAVEEVTNLEDQTIKDLFIEAGSYVLTKEFEKDGLPYFLFVEGTSEGEAADIKFDEFDIENIDGFLVEILDEERNFVDDITLKDIKGSLEEAEGDEEEVTSIPDLDTPVEKVIEVAKEQIDVSEAPVAAEELKNKPEEHKEEVKKEETLQLTGFNEASETSKFFAGKDGDIPAADFVIEKNLKDYKIEWDSEKDGYLISWGQAPVEESREEGVHKIKKDSKLFKRGMKKAIKESQYFKLGEKEELAKAEEIIKDNKEEEPVEKIVDVNAETVDDLKKSYIGSTILQCPVCKTMIYKDPKDLVKPEGENAEGEKLYNIGEPCPHCGAKDGFELIGQVASLGVDTEKKPEPPMIQPTEQKPVESQPAAEVKPVEQPKEEKPVETIKSAEEEQEMATLEPENVEEKPAEEGKPEGEEGKEEKKKKKPKVSRIPEEPVKESIVKEETKTETMNETYQDVILETLQESKFDRLAKKYLSEVYKNVESYVTRQALIDNDKNKIVIEGVITFKSGLSKETTFVFEAREITKKGKLKLVGINETFTKKKAFTLVGEVEKRTLISESLTYSYKIDDKKVYGQVKNPTKI